MSDVDLAGRVRMAEGGGGRLFLEGASGASTRELYARPWSDDAGLERQWGASVRRLADLAEEIGARLVVLIAPDAHAVHTADLPDGWTFQRPTVADRFQALFGGRVEVVLPHAELTAARGGLDPYRPTDSHWSAAGAYVAYRVLMQRLATQAPRVIQPEDFLYEWREEAGDLGGACEPPRREPTPRVVMRAPRAREVFDACNHRRHMIKTWEVDDPTLPSCLMLRDSFATEMAPFMAESFRRSVLVAATTRAFPDLIREERPDVIVVERAERGLPGGVVDWDLLTWREHWPAPGAGPREADAARAERDGARALDAGDPGAAELRAFEAVELGPTPDRRLLLGRARLQAGDPHGAAGALAEALAAEPGRWSFVMHLGIARLAQSRPGEARDLFARACALAPWHPLAFEHFGYACLALGEVGAARAALEHAVRLGPELIGAWAWLLNALERMGDRPALEAAYARARAAPVDIPGLAA